MRNTLAHPIRGIVPPLVTPLLKAEMLDVLGLHRVMERVLKGRVHGLFVLGSTGESASLSMDLRRAVIGETCAALSGRMPVLINVSETAFTHSLQLSEHAANAGAMAVALSPPCYFPLTQQDVLYYVKRFAEKSPLPVFLYNVPQYAHNEFAPETVGELSRSPNIVGLKNSNGSLEYLHAVRKAVAHRPEFSVLVGNEETLLPALLAGAHGGVCGGANMFPELYVQVYDAVSGGRHSEAEVFQNLIVRVAKTIYTVGPAQTSYLRGLKCALSLLGVIEDVLAEPLHSFDRFERAELQTRLDQVLKAVETAS